MRLLSKVINYLTSTEKEWWWNLYYHSRGFIYIIFHKTRYNLELDHSRTLYYIKIQLFVLLFILNLVLYQKCFIYNCSYISNNSPIIILWVYHIMCLSQRHGLMQRNYSLCSFEWRVSKFGFAFVTRTILVLQRV